MGDHRTTVLMEDISKTQADSHHYQEEHHHEASLHAHPFHDKESHHVNVMDGSVGELMAAHSHVPAGVMDVVMDVVREEPLNVPVAAAEAEASIPHEHEHPHPLVNAFAEEALAGPEQGLPPTKRQRLDEAGAASVAATAAATSDAAQNKKIHNEQWNEMLERLKAYKAKYGNCLVPKRFSEDGKLGTWVETQRVQYKRLSRVFDEALGYEVPQANKRLTAERLQKLNDLGFCWSAKHIRKTGSTGSLGSASSTPNAVRAALNSIAEATMTVAENVTAASEVPDSVSFVPNDAGATATDSRTAGSTAAATNGTAAVPATRAAPDSSAFPNYTYRAASRKTSPVNADAQWEDFYSRLVKFKEWHGHVLVPKKYESDPKLAAWVESQRALWNRDQNPVKEKNQNPPATTWTTDPAASTTAQPPATAVSSTVKRLSLERKQKLDDLGFVWSLRSKRIEDHWDEMFKQLAEYKTQHGDCLVPSRYEANLKLGKVGLLVGRGHDLSFIYIPSLTNVHFHLSFNNSG
jgi:hypothetical protein